MNYRFIIPIFLFLLISISIIIGNFLHQSEDDEVNSLNEQSIHTIETVYKTIVNGYKITSQKHFMFLMKNSQVMQLLKQYKYELDQNKKDLLRGQLFRLLNKNYKVSLKKLGIRQFHFHTHDGKSLLRFHKPQKSGDSLIGIRKSVEYVNSALEPFYGFEGGKIFPGFRYVFPIIFEEDYLGSVEFSISFDTIEEQMQQVLPQYGYQLHLDKSISYEKVFDKFKDFFVPSPILEDHYVENSSISSVEYKLQNNEIIQRIQSRIKSLIPSKTFTNKDAFSIYFIEENKGYKAIFSSIKDNDNNHVAYITSYENFERFIIIEKKYFYFHILFYFTIITLLLLVFFIIKQINNLQRKSKNIQQILDTQENIVILSNSHEMTFANNKFFNFFGFESLDHFKQHHTCICEFFSENERFFHLGKIRENESWIEVMQTLPLAQRVVSMLGKDFVLHAFSVSINKFDDNFMVVSFSNISQTMLENIELQEKIIRDKLTNAFNREYFELSYKILIEKYEDGKHHLAIALLDIDHFKKVNDTFGHDIGDTVLIQFVKTIQKYSRQDDILVRWGGEEFILMLKVQTQKDLYRVLEHLRKKIELEKFSGINQLTCSIGGTLYKKGEDILLTVKRADEAVYEAKANGRNQVGIK